MIERKLDVLIPISHQPRELISEIIADASGRFPEFSSCVRKRIRTFLKSFRRSKKVRDHQPGLNGVGSSPHHSKVHGMALSAGGLLFDTFSLSLPPLHHQDHTPPLSPPPSLSNMADLMGVSFPLPSQHSHTEDQVSGCGRHGLPGVLIAPSLLAPQPRPAVVSVSSEAPLPLSSPPVIDISDLPRKRLKLEPSDVLGSKPHPSGASASLSGSEVSAVRQLITGEHGSQAEAGRVPSSPPSLHRVPGVSGLPAAGSRPAGGHAS